MAPQKSQITQFVVIALLGFPLGCEQFDTSNDSLPRLSSTFATCVSVSEGDTATLSCPDGQTISRVDFASYGTAQGSCETGFTTGSCHASSSQSKVEDACLDKQSCTVKANNGVFGDPCGGVRKKLSIIHSCSGGTQNGLLGTYFDNMDFTEKVLERIDRVVNFDWGRDSPASSIESNSFSVRWTGFVKPQFSETYTFYTISDDGVRLSVNNKQIINNWTNHGPTENKGTISLQAGTSYSIKMEYFENGGGAVAKLLWSSRSQGKESIPEANLSTEQSGDDNDDDDDDNDDDNDNSTSSCTQAMERDSAKLSCATGERITSIDFASYGLPKGSCDNGFDINNACHAANSSSKVSSACLNKQSCTVAVSNGLFGNDPCPGTRKKLTVEYSCSGGEVEDLCPNDPNKMVPGECGCGKAEGTCDEVAKCTAAQEREKVTLSCASGEKITSIDFASYGLPKGSCDQGFDINNSCHAANSSSKVTSACLNKQSCTLEVSNGLLGNDPCPGTRKKLAVEYSCSGGDVEDQCPNDPNKMVPGECGCGKAEGTCGDVGGECDSCGTCDNDPTNDCMAGLEYYGTNVPSYLTPVPQDYELFDTNVSFNGGMDGINHEPTQELGAGKFVYNRIYRASKHGQNYGEQYGIFHWWLKSYGVNSIEGGVWVNARPAGPHYYPTLHLAGVGDTYHTCNDVGFGSGLWDAYIGDKWRTMFQISNEVLFIPGVNIAFDKEQPPHKEDNGIWIGWGWTYLNLDHPLEYKFWMSFIEAYDYQGPIVGYVPEHFNFIDPKKVADGTFQNIKESNNPFGTFATLGSNRDWGIANEQYSSGLRLDDDLYLLPVPRVPSYKEREFVVSNIQNISQDTMEEFSSDLKSNTSFDSMIETDFLAFTGVHGSTHSQLKIHERFNGEEHLTIVRPPYSVGYDTYNGYVEWDTSDPATNSARNEQNGFMYYRKTGEKYEADGSYADHPHLYKSKLVSPPDNVRRVPRVATKYNSYKARNTSHPDFASWDTSGRTKYKVLLQNGSTATYVWYKFIEQPAIKAAQQNWPQVYTNEYLNQLQSYIEALHRKVARESRVNPSEPVFINYENPDNNKHFDPNLAHLDPAQLVKPPNGFEVGYVPVIISVYYPDKHSSNGTGLVNEPHQDCTNSDWSSNSYFPNF